MPMKDNVPLSGSSNFFSGFFLDHSASYLYSLIYEFLSLGVGYFYSCGKIKHTHIHLIKKKLSLVSSSSLIALGIHSISFS